MAIKSRRLRFTIAPVAALLVGCSNVPTMPDNCMQKCPALQHDAKAEPLFAVNETREIEICACDPWNDRGVRLQTGHTYRFDIKNVKNWEDGGVAADPEQGWLTWMRYPGALFWFLRREPGQKWYTLVGNINKNAENFFPIRKEHEYTPTEDGALLVFANDMASRYQNNEGTLTLVIRRIK